MQTHKTFALLSKIYVLDFFLVCSFFPQDVTGVYITIILPQTMDKFVFSQTGKRYVDFVYLYLSCFILPHVIAFPTGIMGIGCKFFFYNGQVHIENPRFIQQIYEIVSINVL